MSTFAYWLVISQIQADANLFWVHLYIKIFHPIQPDFSHIPKRTIGWENSKNITEKVIWSIYDIKAKGESRRTGDDVRFRLESFFNPISLRIVIRVLRMSGLLLSLELVSFAGTYCVDFRVPSTLLWWEGIGLSSILEFVASITDLESCS